MALEDTRDSLKQRGLRLTRQRQILLDLLDHSGQHLDAERLYQMAKEKDPKLNRVTVYRTLKLLKKGGLVDELDLMHHEGDQHYYETRLKQEHAHVICLRCGKVEEFFGEPLQRLRKQIESHFGFQVLLAGDGAEGQRALKIHHPDVILLDLAMPNVNGWDFLQRLRETGHLGTTPIIVVSAHLRIDPQAVLQMGVSAILPKPFNLPDLINLIEHLSP